MWCKTYTQHTLAYDGIFLSLSPAHQIAKPLPERNTCPATGARSELAAFCQGWILPLFCIRHKQGFCLGKKKKKGTRGEERGSKNCRFCYQDGRDILTPEVDLPKALCSLEGKQKLRITISSGAFTLPLLTIFYPKAVSSFSGKGRPSERHPGCLLPPASSQMCSLPCSCQSSPSPWC